MRQILVLGSICFFELNDYLAKLMEPWSEYEAEIEEIHHTEKKDAPSGTAITLAEGILRNSTKERWVLAQDAKLPGEQVNVKDENPLMIEAKRIKDVKGTHIIKYSSKIDSISITHEAFSRDGFAKGAILAAEWLQNKTGIFNMKDVLGLKHD